MYKLTADFIFPVDSEPRTNAILILDDNGVVLDIIDKSCLSDTAVELHQGILVPGFINSHCHLELSHMKNLIPTGTGLIPFISNVVKDRNINDQVIQDAIKSADQEMWRNGIVAVGDISNKTDTAIQKSKSKIAYYSFVEMFDFLMDSEAEKTFQQYKSVYKAQSDIGLNKKSYVPHAPYTVSKTLFKKIRELNSKGSTISIHNQETEAEDQLFLDKKGQFIEFYKNFDIPLDQFEATYKRSIYYAMSNMDPGQKTLFVHNTLTKKEDIAIAKEWSDRVYWATCPNANLYIENRLPNYQDFLDEKAKMTIGTDSLSSNWQLSILEEMKTIQKYQSSVPFNELVRWATLNGAEALGYDDIFGSFKKGKKPGVNLIRFKSDVNNFNISNTSVRKLA